MIRFQCTCGKRLKVERAHAGCVVECTACGRKMRAPEDPAKALDGPEALAAAVRAFHARGQDADADEPTPTDHAAAGLAALAGVPLAAPRGKPARDSRQAKTSQKTPVRPTDLLAKRHPSVRSNHRPLWIATGIVAGALVLVVVILAISANLGRSGPPPAAPEPQPFVHVQPPPPPTPPTPEAPAPLPGELFPNVTAQKPSESAVGSPEPPK